MFAIQTMVQGKYVNNFCTKSPNILVVWMPWMSYLFKIGISFTSSNLNELPQKNLLKQDWVFWLACFVQLPAGVHWDCWDLGCPYRILPWVWPTLKLVWPINQFKPVQQSRQQAIRNWVAGGGFPGWKLNRRLSATKLNMVRLVSPRRRHRCREWCHAALHSPRHLARVSTIPLQST